MLPVAKKVSEIDSASLELIPHHPGLLPGARVTAGRLLPGARVMVGVCSQAQGPAGASVFLLSTRAGLVYVRSGLTTHSGCALVSPGSGCFPICSSTGTMGRSQQRLFPQPRPVCTRQRIWQPLLPLPGAASSRLFAPLPGEGREAEIAGPLCYGHRKYAVGPRPAQPFLNRPLLCLPGPGTSPKGSWCPRPDPEKGGAASRPTRCATSCCLTTSGNLNMEKKPSIQPPASSLLPHLPPSPPASTACGKGGYSPGRGAKPWPYVKIS